MENKIRNAIESGDLDYAKDKIKEMEVKLTEESSLYLQSNLKKQLAILKDLYCKKLSIELTSTRELPRQVIHANNNNLDGQIVESVQSADVLIENCKFIKNEIISCSGTLNLRNVEDSRIECHCAHVRMTGCTGVELVVLRGTGIYLHECSNIRICRTGNESAVKVFDFSSPLSSKNYSII